MAGLTDRQAKRELRVRGRYRLSHDWKLSSFMSFSATPASAVAPMGTSTIGSRWIPRDSARTTGTNNVMVKPAAAPQTAFTASLTVPCPNDSSERVVCQHEADAHHQPEDNGDQDQAGGSGAVPIGVCGRRE